MTPGSGHSAGRRTRLSTALSVEHRADHRPYGFDLVLVDCVAHVRVDARSHASPEAREDLLGEEDARLGDMRINVAATDEHRRPFQASLP